ncbi:MAG TPA: hypothetical protein PLE77_13450 [Kiritimatiellia bacterium]|nr:hypothetical protein [Kiritimatiellia bacterium]
MRASWMVVLLSWLWVVSPCLGGGMVLFDFEDGIAGWEHESPTPDKAEHATDRARSGRGALAFTHQFGAASRVLHCRVASGFQSNMAAIDGFRGLSAWVFIPNGKPVWEARMFVHCGEKWTWNEGPMMKSLQPGWNRIEMPAEAITDASDIKDIGLQISNPHQTIESRILIDRVEVMTSTP